MTKDTFTIGLVQMRMRPDAATNLAKAEAAIAEAAKRGAEVVCLPELFTGPYFCQKEDADLFDLAEPIPGPQHRAAGGGGQGERRRRRRVAVRAADGRACTTTPPPSTTRTAGSSACTARCTSRTTRSTSRSITSPPATWASRCSTPAKAKVGTLVCWDQWYPEAARLTALQGAEVIFYPTAIGWHPKEKAEYGEAQHERLGDEHAGPRHRQRHLRGRRQPHRPRTAAQRRQERRPGVLGRLVRERPVRPPAGEGERGQGRGAGGDVRAAS